MSERNAAPGRALDRIYVEDLHVRCIVGINPDERTKKQDVIINLILWAELRSACASDDIADTVNYSDLKKRILDEVESSADLLVERLADRIASLCLATPRVERVRVRVDKPGALRFAKSVAVEIERTRPTD